MTDLNSLDRERQDFMSHYNNFLPSKFDAVISLTTIAIMIAIAIISIQQFIIFNVNKYRFQIYLIFYQFSTFFTILSFLTIFVTIFVKYTKYHIRFIIRNVALSTCEAFTIALSTLWIMHIAVELGTNNYKSYGDILFVLLSLHVLLIATRLSVLRTIPVRNLSQYKLIKIDSQA